MRVIAIAAIAAIAIALSAAGCGKPAAQKPDAAAAADDAAAAKAAAEASQVTSVPGVTVDAKPSAKPGPPAAAQR